MQISTTKDALFAPLALVSGAADSHGQVPMLSNILFRTLDGSLSMLCSDSTVLARSLAPCTVEKEGTFAVDARRFGDLIHALPDKQDINMSLDEQMLLVKCGRSRFKLPVFPAADYPRMQPAEEVRVTVTMAAKQLAAMFEQVSDAMSINDPRACLNGALVSIGSGFLTLVGTDGNRMVIAREPLGGDTQSETREIILPRRTVMLARKLLAQGDKVKVAIGQRDAHFTFNDKTIIIAHAIDGKFPNWQAAIPTTTGEATVVSRQMIEAVGLINATTVAAAGTEKKSIKVARGAVLAFTESLLAMTNGDDHSRCEIDVRCNRPNSQTLSFNIDYLRSAVGTVGAVCEKMRLCFPADNNVIAVKPEAAEYPLAVVMGIRM